MFRQMYLGLCGVSVYKSVLREPAIKSLMELLGELAAADAQARSDSGPVCGCLPSSAFTGFLQPRGTDFKPYAL